MSKILTDKEMCAIIHGAVHGEEIDDSGSYIHFLEDLGELIADHFGGDRGTAGFGDEELGYTCAFRVNECVPDDGGVYAKYDTDVTWKDGKETQ